MTCSERRNSDWISRLRGSLKVGKQFRLKHLRRARIFIRVESHSILQIPRALDAESNGRERMRYSAFRRRGLFVGSAVIEAGCTLIGSRSKHVWPILDCAQRVKVILALRCRQFNSRLEDYVET